MKKLLFIISIAYLAVSCNMEQEQEITWNIEKYPDLLVVESIITNEFKQQAVHISLTNPYFNNSKPKEVSGAEIVINEGENKIYTFTESAENPGWYFSNEDFSCTQQQTYSLTISLNQPVNGVTQYTAISKMPTGLVIDSIKGELFRMPNLNEFGGNDDKDTTILGVQYFGYEPNEPENYYFTKLFVNNKPIDTNPKDYQSYIITKENASYSHAGGYLYNAKDQDTLKFRLYTINKGYYNYLESLSKMEETGNAFSMSGPPANAIGNISNNAPGYFLAAFVSEKVCILKKDENPNQ